MKRTTGCHDERKHRERHGGNHGSSACARFGIAVIVVFFSGCRSMEQSSHERSVATHPEPFVQRIPGTTVTIEMVPVPSSGAHQGSGPTLWFSRTEVTWDLYDVFLYGLDDQSNDEADGVTRPSKPYVPPDRGFGHEGYPAIGMTYHAAKAFCHWLTVRTGCEYRIPTDPEWSLACQAGQSPGPIGEVDEIAWYAANSNRSTHAVGTKRPDSLGLFDMVGNAAEWTTGTDGTPVACGGSFVDGAGEVGCDSRKTQEPSWNASDPQIPKSRWWLADCPFVGLRVVCEGPLPNK